MLELNPAVLRYKSFWQRERWKVVQKFETTRLHSDFAFFFCNAVFHPWHAIKEEWSTRPVQNFEPLH